MSFRLLILGVLSFFVITTVSGQVTISEESEITQLMQKFKAENKKKSIIRAWKIQILTTNDRREMEQGISKFEMLYPKMKQTWEHNPPYYQVRTGAYELREDLEAMLLELKQHFPSAIPVQAEMKKTDLL